MMVTGRPDIFLALNAAAGETENEPNTFQGSAEGDSRFLSNAVKCESTRRFGLSFFESMKPHGLTMYALCSPSLTTNCVIIGQKIVMIL